MNIDLSKPWPEVFAAVAAMKAEEKQEKRLKELDEQILLRDREKRVQEQKKEEKEKEQKDTEQATALMLASSERIEAFSAQVDELDTATVKALMKNREALDLVQSQLHDMLDKAAQLPDGRHVFKTDDGERVFDEHGVELSREMIDPHSIDDRLPRWEVFETLKRSETRLEAERQEQLTYQAKLDETHAHLAKGGVTNGDLDKLKADLQATMPQSVRDEVAHKAGKPGGPRQSATGPAPNALDLDDALRRSVPAPQPM